MIRMVGYEVTYQRRAFKSSVDPDGLPRQALYRALEIAAVAVQAKSNGRWVVMNKTGFVSSDKYTELTLMVVVPIGDDQYAQFLAALRQFESCIEHYPLMLPIDHALRSVEADESKPHPLTSCCK